MTQFISLLFSADAKQFTALLLFYIRQSHEKLFRHSIGRKAPLTLLHL